ncbi:protease Do-like 5, chloroplastic isoform X1 [Lycium barbarum]|uniref:protease Do-like 5, chloroplastic isoform X1 n=1 Tax=Lycium barbarum TaxID=112863 RepID=UPI00293F0204|nr:protease Do-like 5, chloroplastic isoform X1 [Lycium barbarum]XP_060179044.1 protease Do-like 5, chloroplastic isoform X1 [Lycium barbarum]
MVVLGVFSPQHIILPSVPTPQTQMPPQTQYLTRRKALIFTSSSLLSSFIYNTSHHHSPATATAFQIDQPQQEEDTLVHLFQETSPSVVFIKDLELAKGSNDSTKVLANDENAKVEGTGSGFIWDKFGHIVTNYHVVAKLATDQTGLQRCKVSLVNAKGESIAKEAKIVGVDPAYDLAVLKVDVEGDEVKPVSVGSSRGLRVGQSCFAIGNPYGYENTLTTGVVSGLGREIPAPNGAAIKGAIQTDAAINAGNSGGPLIDSSGHVIGVNTATFTLRGSGMSSGVNFAIPIDTVVRTIPFLIVYGTTYKDRY